MSMLKQAQRVWKENAAGSQKAQALQIANAFTKFVHEAQARGCTWESMAAFTQGLHTLWRQCLIDVCMLYDHPPDESQCTFECMKDGCIATLHCDKVATLALYGCVRHGSFHNCTRRFSECECQYCDEHMQCICIFSGIVLGYENAGYSGNESRRRTDGGERNADQINYDRSTQISSYKRMQTIRGSFTNYAMERRRRDTLKRKREPAQILEETLPECKHAALAHRIAHHAVESARQDREDKLRDSRMLRASLGDANGRTKETAAYVYARRAEQKIRCCIEIVLRHLLFDDRRRVDLNRQIATETFDKANAAVFAYHSECKRRNDIPNHITSAERYRNAMNQLNLLTECAYDPVRHEILVSRITKLWRRCNTSPYYKQANEAASRLGCTLKQFTTAALYVMSNGFTFEDESGYTHILVPKDTDLDLALHLPPESMLSMFGATQADQDRVHAMRPSASSSMLLENGQLVNESEFIVEWRREPALSGSVGKSMQGFAYDKKDVTKGRNFITKALSSFGNDVAMLQRIGSI